MSAGDGLSPRQDFVELGRPEELPLDDLRNDLEGLSGVPLVSAVGLIDASTDASTQKAQVLVNANFDLTLDTFVVSAQRLVNGEVLFHYGIVNEVSGRVEGAETATDTARLAAAALPGERFRRADVAWIRTFPEMYLPPSSGARVWIAEGQHRARALFLDKMSDAEALPIGLDMNNQIVFMPYSFLNGDRGAHVSISGKSGVATKTSYALFLLYMLFETDWGVRAREASPHDQALVFSVKGADLCLLDKANSTFFFDESVGGEARVQWSALGVDEPGPFKSVAVFAPADDVVGAGVPVPYTRVREVSETHAYGWSPRSFVENGLLEYVFDDLESGQISFIEQAVRLQLLRWAYPLAGDSGGRLVMVDPEIVGDSVGKTWESAARALRSKVALGLDRGVVIESFDDLVSFVASKVADDAQPEFDPSWAASVAPGTRQAFVRRLWKSTPRLRRLVGPGLKEVRLGAGAEPSGKQINVVDVHMLHADAQRFVVASVLAQIWAEHEGGSYSGRKFVVLDELNKYAPRSSSSPIKNLLVDVAARGRSLGVILIGAQQNPSGVDKDITNNASLEVVGQIKSSEAGELGFLPAAMRSRAQIIAPGTMITSQPLLPAPVPLRFPFPPYATRVSERLRSEADREEVKNLLEDM